MAMHFKMLGRTMGGLCLTAWLATTTPATAQNFSSQPPGPRQLVNAAKELHVKCEYDAAAQLYQQAAANKDLLTPNERADLGILMQKNATAQKTRLDGLILVEQAEKSLAAGKANEAEAYVRYAQSNPCLSESDKQRLQAASQAAVGLRNAQADAGGKNDTASLLVRAREALKRGDFESAETFARQAERSRSFVGNLQFWGDSPSRVLDDVRSARARAPKNDPATAAQMGSKPGEFIVPGPNPMTTANDNSYDPTKAVANYSPAAGGDRAKVKAQARQIVMDGYKALETNNLDQAKALAVQAKEMRADLGEWEPNPDKLLADIGRRAAANDLVVTGNNPVDLLRQGRSAFLQQRFDEAEKYAVQADSLNRRYGLFEDSPKKLRDDIARERTKLDVDRAGKLTLEARRQLKQNNYAEARSLATQAKQLNGQTSFFGWSDTPDAVLRDVARLEKTNPQAPSPFAPSPTDIAQTGSNSPANSLESSQSRMQAKSRATQLVAEARALENQNQLVEARTKALEAQKLFAQWGPTEESPALVLRDLSTKASTRVKSLLNQATEIVVENPGDTTRFQKADNCLVLARRLAEAFMQDTAPIEQKVQWLALASSQSSNSQIATAPLQSVQFAKAGNIEEPSEPTAKLSYQDGMKKLDQARLELKAGNTVMARRMAEDAFAVASIRDEAQKVLRTIDDEEDAQNNVVAQRNFQAGMDAYKHQDFRKAANLLANIDVRRLQPDQARKLGEVIATREMRGGVQPDGLTKTAFTAPDIAGKATASSDADDPHLSAARQMQKIQADKFRDMSRAAQTRALELSKAGQNDKAIDVLQDYQVKLKDSGLEDIHVTGLNRPVEDRIQKLRTTMAQKEIEREQANQTGKKYSEIDRVAKKTKVQEQVVDLLARGNQHYREGQYDEAIAKAKLAKELDSDNISAGSLITVATFKKNEQLSERARLANEQNVIGMLDPGSIINPTNANPVVGDKDRTRSNILNRKQDYSVMELSKMSSREIIIERKLSQPISLKFENVPLYRVLQDLPIMSGLNIVTDNAALNAENISLEQQLSFSVENISLKSALTLLLNQVKLTYVIKNEVLFITTPGHAEGKRKLRTYSIADLVVPVEDHATDTINNFNEALKRHISTTGGGVRYNAPVPYTGPNALQNGTPVSQNTPYGGGQTGKAPGSTTIEHLVVNLIENTIAPNSWERAGGEGRIQYFPLGHALVISQVQEVQEEVFELLKALRRLQDIQISIEMRIVSVSEKFFERIGLDFDVNIKTPQNRSENQLITGSFGGPFNVNRNNNIRGVFGVTPAGQITPDLNIPLKSSSFDFSVPPFGGFPGTLGADGGLSLGLAFLSDIQVFMFLEAAQGDQRTHVMQAPKLTVFNGQTANINVQDQMFFLTGVSIAQAGSQTFFVPQNQPFPVGVGMQVTPVVSADRRFVRLNLVPQITNLVSANVPLIPVQIPIPQLFDAPNGQGFQAGQPVIFQMFFQQPTFTTINLQTTVNVPDGGTVLLGGLKTLAEGRNEFGPPILSKIPYLSRLFRNQAFGREAQSIMIMVTPRIIINEEIEAEILGNQQTIPRN